MLLTTGYYQLKFSSFKDFRRTGAFTEMIMRKLSRTHGRPFQRPSRFIFTEGRTDSQNTYYTSPVMSDSDSGSHGISVNRN
jgi:hypothetical protein